MKVLLLSPFYPARGGGVERVAMNLALELSNLDVQVTWMAGARPGEVPAGEDFPGVELSPVRDFDLLGRWIGLPAPVWFPSGWVTLWQRIQRADVVHVHEYLYLSQLVAIGLARWFRKPVVLTQHIGDIPFRSAFPRWVLKVLNRTVGALALRACNAVVFIAAPVRQYFEQSWLPPRISHLIPNGVNHQVFSPHRDGAAKVQTQFYRILFVGRFVEKKGISFLRLPVEQLMATQWDFVGTGPLSPALWDLPDAARNRMALHQNISLEKLADLFRSADLLVLPSTGEGFPAVLQEALACGTPVLVSQEVADAFNQSDSRCVRAVELRYLSVDQASSAVTDAIQTWIEETGPTSLRSVEVHRSAVELARQWSWSACGQAYKTLYQNLVSTRFD